MRFFLKVISYLFHPIFTPTVGTLTYFIITPKYSPLSLQIGNLLPIFILTVIIPLISYLILNNIGLVNSIYNPSLRERRYPLYITLLILLMIIYKVIPNNYTPELYYFFLGLISATFITIILLFFKFNSSLHMTGIGTYFMYLICLSIHFEKNITIAISITMLLIGLLVTTGLYFKTHKKVELLVGLLVGLFTQLITVKYWL